MVWHATILHVFSFTCAAMAAGHPGETPEFGDLMNEGGEPLPNLEGMWEDGQGSKYVLRRIQPLSEVVVPPNSTYAIECAGGTVCGQCRLQANYDYRSRQQTFINVSCHRSRFNLGQSSKLQSQGQLGKSKTEIFWAEEPSWQLRGRAPSKGKAVANIHTVHMVFMNHYDVGYTGFINAVDDQYMHKYFTLAANTAEEMRKANSSDRFIYITHPWLVQRFLECPCPASDHACLARSLGNDFAAPLTCPSDEEKRAFEAAVQRGDIVWHAGPFNTQPENMSPELMDAGIEIARRLDEKFYGKGGKISQTLNIRDAIYSTRSILPRLKKYNVTGLTIGSNGANFPPQVPKLHRWVDPSTGADVIVAYHAYGYGGYGAGDCAESPNGVALCTEFRTDNTGPPANVKEVVDALNSVRKLYPGALVKASTFDAFIADVMPIKEQLPVVDLELGDTWVYGNPSDPLKMAIHRAVQRSWIECLRSGDPSCDGSNPAIQNMTWWLLKAPEHTWGTPGIAGWGGGNDYDLKRFQSQLKEDKYMKAAASWAEQSIYNELAIQALEEAGHPLATKARAEASVLENVQEPKMDGYTKVADVSASVVLQSQKQSVKLAFGPDGSITTLESVGVAWASKTNSLASFVYQTLAEDEWQAFTYAYCNDHKEETGFSKPGSGNYTESKLWRPTIQDVWVRHVGDASTSVDSAVARMVLPEKAASVYGAPQSVYVNVTIAASDEGAAWALDIAVTTLGKQPVMIGEAQLLTFRPAPALRPPTSSPLKWREAPGAMECPLSGCIAPSAMHGCKDNCPGGLEQCCWDTQAEAAEQCGKWEDCAGFWGPWNGSHYYARGAGYSVPLSGFDGAKHWVKEAEFSSPWRIDKLGGAVDPEGVQDGGTQYTHGVWDGATVETMAGDVLKIKSLDAPNMNPMTASFPVGNPLPASYNKTEAKAGKGLSRLQPGSVVGMAVNLHNNLWNTNYPLYYPFYDKRYCTDPLKCRNANLLFRFRLSASKTRIMTSYI